jgi:hypothetical protein
VLGENLLPVEEDFERSRVAGGDRHRPNLIVVIVQQVLRQTGGSRQIASGRAVLDANGWLLCILSLAGGAFVSHVNSSVHFRSSRGL